MEDKTKKKIVLMCCKDCHCPSVTVGAKEVVIEDDHGGLVKLTFEQFNLLKEKVKKGDFD